MKNKTYDNMPQRLIDSPDFGPLIEKVQPINIDEERLSQNRRMLVKRLHDMDTSAAGRHPLARFANRRMAVAVIAVMLMISAGAAAVIYYRTTKNHSVPTQSSVQNNIHTSKHPFHQRPPVFTEQEITVPTDNAPETAPTATKPRVKPKRPDSILDAQVKLFNQAKADLKSGNPKRAVSHLKRLKQRYPNSPLALESKELMAHALARQGQYPQAATTINTLLRSKISSRKKAQLYRFLGDIEVKQNRCDQACENYRRALGLGLNTSESNAAKAGIRKCLNEEDK